MPQTTIRDVPPPLNTPSQTVFRQANTVICFSSLHLCSFIAQTLFQSLSLAHTMILLISLQYLPPSSKMNSSAFGFEVFYFDFLSLLEPSNAKWCSWLKVFSPFFQNPNCISWLPYYTEALLSKF